MTRRFVTAGLGLHSHFCVKSSIVCLFSGCCVKSLGRNGRLSAAVAHSRVDWLVRSAGDAWGRSGARNRVVAGILPFRRYNRCATQNRLFAYSGHVLCPRHQNWLPVDRHGVRGGLFFVARGRGRRSGLGLGEIEAPFAAFLLQSPLLILPQFLDKAVDF